MKRAILYIGIVALLALASTAYVLFSQKKSAPTPAAVTGVFSGFVDDSTSTVALTPATTTPKQPPANAKEYTNAAYRFSLYYPDDLAVAEHSISGNSMVITFQDAANQQGFEIFVTPYDQPKITQQRFTMDEPSGVMNDPQNITVDGAPATEFLSTNDAMGASREIWFLHSGYLYEVTAPQALDSWLLQIMGTFTFTP